MLSGLSKNRPYAAVIVGAGSGIGRAAAEYLAGEGVAVGCLDRDGAAAAETARRIERFGAKTIAVTADVTDERTIPPAIDRIVEALGSLEALVNCAGITGKTNLKGHEVDLTDFDASIASICAARWWSRKPCCRACWRKITVVSFTWPRSLVKKGTPGWRPTRRRKRA